MAETNGEGLAKRWNDWRSSQEGTRCCDFSTIGNGQYLENRLWRAFMAGGAAPFLPSADMPVEKLARKISKILYPFARFEGAHKSNMLGIAEAAIEALSSDKVSKGNNHD